MSCNAVTVMFRADNTFSLASLELETQRAFAVVNLYGPDGTRDVIGRERLEMDVQFLQKVNESEYLYKKIVDLPPRSQSRPVMFSPDASEKQF